MAKAIKIVVPDEVTFSNTNKVGKELQETWNTGLNIAADKEGTVEQEIKDGMASRRGEIDIPLHRTNQILHIKPDESVTMTVDKPEAVIHYMNLNIEGVEVSFKSSTVEDVVEVAPENPEQPVA